MPTKNTKEITMLDARKLAANMATWYHRNNIDDTFAFEMSRISFHKESSSNPMYSDEVWAQLMTDAISSFNQGLEDIIEPEGRRASREVYDSAVDLVGNEAFNTIAYVVSAAGVKLAQEQSRPSDLIGQASSIFMEAQTLSQDTAAMQKGQTDTSTGYTRIWQIQQQLESMGTNYKGAAEQIGGLAAQAQELLNALTAYSPQTGASGPGMTGLPTGVSV